MSSASVLAVCAVHELRPDAGTVGTTAIDKRSVTGPVRVGAYGVYADVQADRKNHGGLDKAVYAYAQEDAAYWERELGRTLPAGWFGENLRVSGLDLGAALVGEQWSIGTTVVEVTMPRTPCQTFARWVGGDDERGWVKRFSNARRLGVYLRVVQKGRVQAGDAVTLLARPEDAPTVLEVYRGV